MKKTFAFTVLGAMLLFTLAAHADTSYNIGLTTFYQFGCAANLAFGACGSPDTSFVTITNNGSSTFNGSGRTIDSNFSHFYNGVVVSFALNLAPGQSITFNPLGGFGGENSNQGGYGPNGVEIDVLGSFTNGANTTGPLVLSVTDSQIHSGVFRTNPFGINLDNFVLQGGDPFGRDTGDSFEVTQADGHYSFTHTVNNQVPEPASLALLGSGLIGLAGRLRKRLQ